MLKGFPLVKVITMAYDISLLISLLWSQLSGLFPLPLCSRYPGLFAVPQTLQASPHHAAFASGLCLEQSLPDKQPLSGTISPRHPEFFFFSGLFLNVIFKQRPALNTLYKKSNTSFDPAWAPYPASFPFMTLTISTIGFSGLFASIHLHSLKPDALWKQKLCLFSSALPHHHFPARGKRSTDSYWVNRGLDMGRVKMGRCWWTRDPSGW